MSSRFRLLSLFAVAALALPMLVQAQNAAPSRIRGTIAAVGGNSVDILTREGKKLTLQLSDATRYSSVKALDLASIKQGSFIGTAGKPTPNGGIEALEVVVFPKKHAVPGKVTTTGTCFRAAA